MVAVEVCRAPDAPVRCLAGRQEAQLSQRGRATVCLYLASTIQYLQRIVSLLLLVTSASDLYLCVQIDSVLYSSANQSTDKNDVDDCCYQLTFMTIHDSCI